MYKVHMYSFIYNIFTAKINFDCFAVFCLMTARFVQNLLL